MERRLSCSRLAPVLVLLASAFLSSRTDAAEVMRGEAINIGADQVVNDDVYVSGGSLIIDGRVNGDVVAAGGNIQVNGSVTGDLVAAGGTVTVRGSVGESARVAGGTINIEGRIGRDLVAGGGTVTVSNRAAIQQDVLLGAGTAVVGGTVGRNLFSGAGNLTLSGRVAGNVRAQTNRLEVVSTAVIGGSLQYAAENPAQIAQGAQLNGPVSRLPTPVERRAWPAALLWLRAVVGLFLLGLAWAYLSPRFRQGATRALSERTWVCFGVGIAVLVGIPIVATIVAGIGAVIGGWWLGLIILGLFLIAIPVGFTASSLKVGQWVFTRFGRRAASAALMLLVGVVILLALSFIPFIGPLVASIATVFGLGALAVSATWNRRQSDVLPPVAPTPERRASRSPVDYGPVGGSQTPA